MANLSFLANLNEQQRQYAEIIRARAEELGVPGDLAVAVAYQESRLNPASKDSGAGAVGIMQVRPIAARDVGIDPRSLRDPQKNIDAGILYLKKALDTTGDPRLAVIYYNAGPQRLQEFDQGADLPLETQQYLKDLRNYGAFRRPEPTPEPAVEPSAEPAEDPLANLPAMVAAQERGMAGLAGAGAGAALSGARAGWSGAKAGTSALGGSLAQGVMGKLQTQMPTLAPPQAPAGLPGAPAGAPGQPRPMAAPGGRPAVGGPAGPVGGPATVGGPTQLGVPGTYPTATGPGSAVFNYARVEGLPEIEAAKALGMGKGEGEVYDLLNKRRQALNTIQQRFPSESYVENPRFGGLMTPSAGVGSGPRQSFVQPTAPSGQPVPPLQALPARAPVSTTPPKPSGLDQITKTFGEMARRGMPAVSAIARYAVPPLAGYQAGQELAAAKQAATAEDPDYLQAALRGLGGTAAAASMFPAALPVAAPIALAAPTIAGLLERFQNRQVDEERPITEAELLEASRPAFRYPAMR